MLLKGTFGRLAFAAVQEEAYRERFVHMGVAAEKCVVAGSVKWDNATLERDVPGAAELAREMGIDRTRPLIVAGSTGPTASGGEEKLLHEACPAGVQLLCAPRKPERFAEAAAAMPGCRRRSESSGSAAGTMGGGGTDRFLLDTIGELRAAYSLADVVVVGRSFGDLYGSDPLEPVGLGKATVIGPSVSDFEAIVSRLEQDGGIQRATRESLGEVLSQLLANKDVVRHLRENGLRSIERNRGASQRQVDVVLNMVDRVRGLEEQGG
jgi:3-deoxy-D-manno-octulosonic-acid transferase